jgi:hypothetical protein
VVDETDSLHTDGDAEVPRQTGWKILAVVTVLVGVSVVAIMVTFGLTVTSLFSSELDLSDRDIVQTSESPYGRWTVQVYDISGGAGGHSAYLVKARQTAGGDSYEILRLDPLRDYEIQWANDNDMMIQWQSATTVLIGGIPAEMPAEDEGD